MTPNRLRGARPRTRGNRRVTRAVVTLLAGGALLLGACTGSTPEPTPSTPYGGSSASASGGATPTSGGGSSAATPSGTIAPLGTKFEYANLASGTAYLQSMAAAPTFFEFEWCGIEPSEGQVDWSTVDDAVAKARGIGATMMLKIRTGTCWATVGGEARYSRGNSKKKTESSMPNDLTRYAAFVTAVVQRYAPQGVHVYAVENEINAKSFWSGTPEDYEKLLAVAVPAIRAADPQATVADPGISSTAYGAGIAQRLLSAGQDDAAVSAWNTYYSRRIGTRGAQLPMVTSASELTRALALDQTARNLSYLAMVEHLAADRLVDIRQVHFYESADAAPLFVDYLKATTPAGFPVEAWEVGQYFSGSDLTTAQRADEMVKTISTLLGAGIRLVIWLPLSSSDDSSGAGDTGANTALRLGLIDGSGTVLATGAAFKALSLAATGAQAQAIDQNGLTGVALQRGGSTTAFVWASSDTASAALKVPSGATVADPLTGASAQPSTTSQSPRQITVHTTSAKLLEAL